MNIATGSVFPSSPSAEDQFIYAPTDGSRRVLYRYDGSTWVAMVNAQNSYTVYVASTGTNQFDRGSGSSQATFSDDSAEALNYESLELLDWRQEIINRATATVAPTLPTFNILITSGDQVLTTASPVRPTLVNFATDGAVAGDLVIVTIVSTVYTAGESWVTPAG